MSKFTDKKVDILDELDMIRHYLSVIKIALSNKEYSDSNEMAIVLGDVIQRINVVYTMIDS